MPYNIKDLHDLGLIVMEAVCGSHAFGLQTETSDIDTHGVYLVPPMDRVRVSTLQDVVESDGHDDQYWELSKFLGMLAKANPTALEMLYSPTFLQQDRAIVDMLRKDDQFVTKKCANSFTQYAMQQIKKAKGLNKKIFKPQPQKRLGVLDFCYFAKAGRTIPARKEILESGWDQKFLALCSMDHIPGMFAVYYQDPAFVKVSQKGKDASILGAERYAYGIVRDEEESMDVQLASVPRNEPLVGHLYFNKDAFAKHCKDHKSYWEWVKERNEDRYQGNMEHGGGYDSKNMAHVIRLMHTGKDIALGLGVRVDRSHEREYLLDIKAGKYTYEHLLERSYALMEEVMALSEASSLPDECSVDIDAMLVRATRIRFPLC
jgi:hypothetical protein